MFYTTALKKCQNVLEYFWQVASGKLLVFAMTIKLIPKFWRNQEIPEKFWKTYDQVKLDLFQIFIYS